MPGCRISCVSGDSTLSSEGSPPVCAPDTDTRRPSGPTCRTHRSDLFILLKKKNYSKYYYIIFIWQAIELHLHGNRVFNVCRGTFTFITSRLNPLESFIHEDFIVLNSISPQNASYISMVRFASAFEPFPQNHHLTTEQARPRNGAGRWNPKFRF